MLLERIEKIMRRKKAIAPAQLESISRNLFSVMPLLRKRLLHLDVLQTEHGIPLSHVQVLSMLQENGSMSVSEISQQLGIAKPNITPLFDRLIESGYVDRIRDTRDRRVVNIIILDAGREKLLAIENSISNHVAQWADELTAADFRALDESLETIHRVLCLLQKK